jgi:hypothetical protein
MQAENTTPNTQSAQLKPTRSSFIRSLPESMPVEEVIERGREVGLTIQPSDIHSVRYYMRQEAIAPTPTAPVLGRKFLQPRSVGTPAKVEPRKNGASGPANGVQKQTAFSLPGLDKRPRNANQTLDKRPRNANQTPNLRKLAKPVRRTDGALEDELRGLVMRLGTDRTRAIIEKLENTKI